jgi:drug/metabolite transporter (DMT)-like permease
MSAAAPHLHSESAWIRAMPALFVLIWSTGYIVAKYGMPHAPPFSFLVTRYALSIACFLLWMFVARMVFTPVSWPQGRAQWLHLAVTGALMHAGYLGGVWAAVKAGMGSGLSALIVGLQPVLTALWIAANGVGLSANTHGQHQQRVTARQWLGLALGFGGLVLVVSRKFGIGGEATWLNLSLAFFALISMTIGTLYQKKFVHPCDVRSANTVQLGAALLVSLPFALAEAEPMRWNQELGFAMLWSVLVLTLGGSSLLYVLIQRGAAMSVTSLLYLVPPTTAFMAWVLFNEVITPATIAGTALTAIGVWLVVRSNQRS